jgi:hypothetical protein
LQKGEFRALLHFNMRPDSGLHAAQALRHELYVPARNVEVKNQRGRDQLTPRPADG